MTDRTEFAAIVQEHRRLRQQAHAAWHASTDDRKLPEYISEHMADFWREHPEWRPFNVPVFAESTAFVFRTPPLMNADDWAGAKLSAETTVTMSAKMSGETGTPDDVEVQP